MEKDRTPRFLDRPRLIGACLMLFAVLTFSYAAAAERSPAVTMVDDIPSTHPRIPTSSAWSGR
jgi:hypothetical protein